MKVARTVATEGMRRRVERYRALSLSTHKVGGLQFGDDAEQEHEWVEAMMARLFWGYVDWAIEGLEALQPRDSPAAEEIRTLIGFLRNSAGRLHYRAARKGGYPSGSGGIEAANKCMNQFASSAQVPGGISSRPTACWPCAVLSTTEPLRGSLRPTKGRSFSDIGATLYKNHVMHPIAATYGVHPNQVLQWKKQALEVLPMSSKPADACSPGS